MDTNFEEIHINKLVGFDRDGLPVFVKYLHWNGVSCTTCNPYTQDDADAMVEDYDWDEYKYLWKEAVKLDRTEDSWEEYKQQLKDDDAMDRPWPGADLYGAYSKEDAEIIRKNFGDFEYLDISSCGTGHFEGRFNLDDIVDMELYERCILHERERNAANERARQA